MLPFGHVSASYLISQTRKESRKDFKAIFLIVFAGILFDFDFFLLPLLGYPGGLHHFLPTHTPLMGIFYFLVLFFLFKERFPKAVIILVGVALFVHLILDNLSYWMGLLGIETYILPPIYWLYPFDPGRDVDFQKAFAQFQAQNLTDKDLVMMYVQKTPKILWLEMALSLSALVVFIKNKAHLTS